MVMRLLEFTDAKASLEFWKRVNVLAISVKAKNKAELRKLKSLQFEFRQK
jgi:hypothetical protein